MRQVNTVRIIMGTLLMAGFACCGVYLAYLAGIAPTTGISTIEAFGAFICGVMTANYGLYVGMVMMYGD